MTRKASSGSATRGPIRRDLEPGTGTPSSWTLLARLWLLIAITPSASAQWLTQEITIKPGWTAIYLHVDPSDRTLDQIIGSDPGNPIDEVWLWQTSPTTTQFVTSPQKPLQGSSQWVDWHRGSPGGTGPLMRLRPNSAYLVHSGACSSYTWRLKGGAVAPNYQWTSSGFNFLGFPTPPANPPSFTDFLARAPAFGSDEDEIVHYPGRLALSFAEDDLADLKSVANRLQAKSSAFDSWLHSKLSQTTRDELGRYQAATDPDPAPLATALLPDLNTIVDGASIYDATRFVGITLREQTQTLLAQNPTGCDLQRLNRLLIEDAFSGAIAQNQPLGDSNPLPVFSFDHTTVARGQAFWMRTGTHFNNYFGPFQVSFPDGIGIRFGDATSQSSLRLRNVTSSNITVTLSFLASEAAPGIQPEIDRANAAPPLLVRGSLNPTNLTYASRSLAVNGTTNWNLAPQGQAGSEVVVVLGLNRQQMTLPKRALFADGVYAGLLRFTDSLGLSQIDAPVSATAGSSAGLWVGAATVTQVANYLVTYQRDSVGNLVIDPATGSYVPNSTNTALGPVPQPFPLQLILHNDGSNLTFLQRVFYGLGPGSNVVVATSQKSLDSANLATARRISVATLPWSKDNSGWICTGALAPGGNILCTIPLGYDDHASNPFLHTYHPDHDNLDQGPVTVRQLPKGAESYDINRQITLTIRPPGEDFGSLTQAAQSFSGTYLESITLQGLNGATRTFHVSGAFALHRMSSIATLTRP